MIVQKPLGVPPWRCARYLGIGTYIRCFGKASTRCGYCGDTQWAILVQFFGRFTLENERMRRKMLGDLIFVGPGLLLLSWTTGASRRTSFFVEFQK